MNNDNNPPQDPRAGGPLPPAYTHSLSHLPGQVVAQPAIGRHRYPVLPPIGQQVVSRHFFTLFILLPTFSSLPPSGHLYLSV